MFTGLVTLTGTLAAREPRGPGARLTIALDVPFDDGPLVLGESIAIDGACLSVASIVGPAGTGFEVDASGETLDRTTLGRLEVGGRVHLERALRAGDRLGGHLVTGHVDGVGAMVERRPAGESTWMAFRLPAELARFVAEKGSITVEGVSLTVNRIEGDRFEVMLIPHTLEKTKLGALGAGSAVNLEVDLIARYVARLASVQG
jgi:riboflavin synthase